MWGIFNLFESFVDNVFRDKVSPYMGSILYIDMAFGFADHSGVYVGNGQVVELSGEGVVQKVSRSKGQCDGLSGCSYKCRSCSFQWIKPSCPVV